MPSLQEYRIQTSHDHENPVAPFILEKWIKPQIMDLHKHKAMLHLHQQQQQKQQQQKQQKAYHNDNDHSHATRHSNGNGHDGDDEEGVVEAAPILIGSIIAIPVNADINNMDFLEGSFYSPGQRTGIDTNTNTNINADTDADTDALVGDMVETIGCLADCIILFYDTTCSHRQTAIVRLVKGLERQRASNGSSSSSTITSTSTSTTKEKDIHILILAKEDDHQAMEELHAIRNVLSEGDEKLGDMIQIVPIKLHISSINNSNSGKDSNFKANSNSNPNSNSNNAELGVLKIVRDLLARVADQSVQHKEFVPMDEFPQFAKQVYSKFKVRLGGKVDGDSKEFVMQMRRLGTSLHLHASEQLQDVVQMKVEEFAVVVEEKLAEVEGKQDEVLLDGQKMPILEFGRDSTEILAIASNVLNTNEVRSRIVGPFDGDYVLEQRGKFILKVNDNVRRLFEIQLQSLREYCGRRYESVIEQIEEDDDVDLLDMDEDQLEQRRIKHDTILAEEAKRATETFRIAAENAIPNFVKQEGMEELAAGYTYANALDGLIRDMLKATSDSQSLADDWENVNGGIDDDEDVLPAKTRKGPVKWYEKLAARALVFGVNYLQGWLAYQGIKKAAEERDRMMPKFPLF